MTVPNFSTTLWQYRKNQRAFQQVHTKSPLLPQFHIIGYEHMQCKYFLITHIETKLDAADLSTKPTSGPILSRHCSFLQGHRFYPSEVTCHGQCIRNMKEATNIFQSNKR